MRNELEGRGCLDVQVASTGTWAGLGHGATSEAVRILESRGIDLSRHRSRAFDRDDALGADLIVAMTSVHVREILQEAPEVEDRLRLMKELAEIRFDLPDGSPPKQRLSALLGGTRPPARRDLDVDDPMGLPVSAYQRCVRELETGIEVLVGILCGE